jgi:hypothetical protein
MNCIHCNHHTYTDEFYDNLDKSVDKIRDLNLESIIIFVLSKKLEKLRRYRRCKNCNNQIVCHYCLYGFY